MWFRNRKITMILTSINTALSVLGYKIVKKGPYDMYAPPLFTEGYDEEFVLYSYTDEKGNFDYERYKKIQEEGNKKKLNNVWVLEENIKFLSDYLNRNIATPKFGLCHGTRRGKEQEWFMKHMGHKDLKVIGTEISETASSFPDTIQWDFHDVKPEWIESVDFIYSNSFDHSYDPEKCLKAWISCLRHGGLCIIEHTSAHGPSGADELDPFGAHLRQMPFLIAKWGAGKFSVKDILSAPAKNKQAKVAYTAFIIIQKH